MKKFFENIAQVKLTWALVGLALAAFVTYVGLGVTPWDRLPGHWDELLEFMSDRTDTWFVATLAVVLSIWVNRSFNWILVGTLPLILFVESGLMVEVGKSFAWWCPVQYATVAIFVLVGWIYNLAGDNTKKAIAATFAGFSILTATLFSTKTSGLGSALKNFLTITGKDITSFLSEVRDQIFDDGALLWLLGAIFVVYVLVRKLETEKRSIWTLAFASYSFLYFAYPTIQFAGDIVIPNVIKQHETAKITLAKNVFWEAAAAGEPLVSQYAVAQVTMGRARDNIRPFGGGTISGVVYARKQFSWTLSSSLRHSKPWNFKSEKNKQRWAQALKVSESTLTASVPTEYKTVLAELNNKCARYYKRTDNKGTSRRGRSTFDDLVPIRAVGAHTYYYDPERSCKKM